MKVFVFDAARCNGCHGCQIACKDEHCDNEWLPYALPQPEIGHFWCKCDESVQGQVPKVKMSYQVRMCMHCDKCAVLAVAGDAAYRREDGLVIIDPIKAAGRRDLVDACPHGAVYWNAELELPQKCTGCAHLVDAGEKPRCVDFCQTDALRWGEREEFGDELEGAEVLEPEAGTKPNFYCINLPKLFIAGDVWDPAANEIIEGARITLLDESGAVAATTATDDLGDFWFRQLDPGTYSLRVEADGFASARRDDIGLQTSLNVGDFPLARA